MAAQSMPVVYGRGSNHSSKAYLFAPESGMEPDFSCLKSKTSSSLLSIALGPSRTVWSSDYLSKYGVVLERHFYSPGERKSATIDSHVISMSHTFPARFEYRSVSGHFSPEMMRPKAIMLTPPGLIPDIRLHTVTELTHCGISGEFLKHVAEEVERNADTLQFHPALEDRSLVRIMALLLDECQAAFPSGQVYVDSLIYALATRYLFIGSVRQEKPKARLTGLMPRMLSRIREKVEAHLDSDLSLDSLAKDSGYSRAHFFRIFREATGLTPYEYVLDLRLKRAQELLKHANSNIIDVALSCGFASQSHMTTVFKQHLGMTPGELRRQRMS